MDSRGARVTRAGQPNVRVRAAMTMCGSILLDASLEAPEMTSRHLRAVKDQNREDRNRLSQLPAGGGEVSDD